MQAQIPGAKRFSGALSCGYYIVRSYGAFALRQGLSATMLRNVVGSSVYFPSYELSRRMLSDSTKGEFSTATILLSGGIAGIAWWITIFPLDVIKSRMQGDLLEPSKRLFPTIRHTIVSVWRENPRNFWAGLLPCLVRSFPTNACSFLAFESTRNFLSIAFREDD